MQFGAQIKQQKQTRWDGVTKMMIKSRRILWTAFYQKMVTTCAGPRLELDVRNNSECSCQTWIGSFCNRTKPNSYLIVSLSIGIVFAPQAFFVHINELLQAFWRYVSTLGGNVIFQLLYVHGDMSCDTSHVSIVYLNNSFYSTAIYHQPLIVALIGGVLSSCACYNAISLNVCTGFIWSKAMF